MKEDKDRSKQQQFPLKKDRPEDIRKPLDPFKSTQKPLKEDWSKKEKK